MMLTRACEPPPWSSWCGQCGQTHHELRARGWRDVERRLADLRDTLRAGRTRVGERAQPGASGPTTVTAVRCPTVLPLVSFVERWMRGLRDEHAPLPAVQALEVHPFLAARARARRHEGCGQTGGSGVSAAAYMRDWAPWTGVPALRRGAHDRRGRAHRRRRTGRIGTAAPRRLRRRLVAAAEAAARARRPRPSLRASGSHHHVHAAARAS